MAGKVLLVIDVQQDFLPNGMLAVPNGDEVIQPINRLARHFPEIVLTQDWHPPAHISFASTHGKRPFVDHIQASYGTQALWPDHTIQSSQGAELAPELDLPHAGLVLRKGFRKDMDSYSAFLENDHRTSTGLAGYLRDKGLTEIYIAGLALDYCVGFSALDGAAMGFRVTVIEDAIRGIAEKSMDAMRTRWKTAGVRTARTSDLTG